MKIQQEHIKTDADSSFHLMVNPNLSDLFYWHFHPEYELVYIQNATGTRHVGDHISTFEGSDLVLIGSNIPHLNFDYGVRTDYQKIVLHIQPSFITTHIRGIPELVEIRKLFERASRGIAFSSKAKKAVGPRLLALQSKSSFELYLELLHILKVLSNSDKQEYLHDTIYQNRSLYKEQERLRKIYSYIDQNYHQKIDIDQMARLSNLSKEAFCRYFKKHNGNTFITFLNQYRISQSKRLLMSGQRVSESCYRCGFESLAYYNRVFKRMTGENPSQFRKRYL